MDAEERPRERSKGGGSAIRNSTHYLRAFIHAWTRQQLRDQSQMEEIHE